MKKLVVLLGAVGMMLMSCEASNSTPERVKATFVNYDNSVLYVTSLAYDGTAVYQGDTPTRPTSSESHHYVFSGWDQPLENIKIDTTFIAQYTEEINTYTVDFKNYDDSLLQTTQVKHGEDVVYSADAPVREATKQFTYTFDGWDKPLTNITSSQVIHAQFTETVNQYTVTFQNEDGTVLGTSTVDYGGTAVYEGTTPTKESTESHHFEFVGWDISLENIQDDCVATAQFKSEINQYTVRFLNYDNSELAVVTVDYDGTAVYSGEDPVKPGDQQYSYTFNGWSLPLDHVTSDREVVAQFTETINQYTVTFYNDDGTRLGTSTVEYGGTAVYEGPDPEKEGTAKYSYAFTGWDKSLENITEDCDRYAVFASSVNSYTVTFKNYDGSVLSEETVQYGDDVFYRGDTPTRARTQQYTYTFTGWDGSLEGIVCDTTLTAQYEETVNQYTVTFKDWDGTILYTSTVDYDGTATYNLNDPVRENTQQYTYTFTGWDISLENIQDDCVATAQYLETTNQYTVTFKDWDGTILDTVTVDYGTAATYTKENPAREETQQYSYAFSGWDISLTEITENCVATAQYITTTKQYTVTFKNYDGTILGASTVDYGDTATYDGEVPTKPENQQYSYTFSGWSISLENITGNCEAVAQFENVVKQYTVTFKNWDGSVLDTILVDYGSDAVYSKGNPTRPATQQYTYTFTGWDISLNNITGNSIATAQYNSTVNQYTVTFKNYDGTVLGTKTVDYGTAAAYTGETPTKPATAKYSYVFNGWDAQINNITEDCVRIATFTEVTNKYTVTFKNYDGSILGTSTVEYGNAASYQGNTPTRARTQQHTYTFSGWDISLENVTSDRIATAQYDSTVNQYTVTFKNYDGTVLGTSTVDYGSTAVYGGSTPTKPATDRYSYSFSGWDKSLANVIEDYAVIAQYNSSVNQYTVTFKNYDGTVLGTSTVDYGSTAVYGGSTPTKPASVDLVYSFTGWDISLTNVTSNRIAVAQYSSSTRQYTVTFKNYDGSVLQEGLVNYGGTASYAGETPTRASDAQYTYSFEGWDRPLSNIEGDTIITAQYSSTVRSYTITFKNYDGTILQKSTVNYDANVKYTGATPTRASDAGSETDYLFNGWGGDYNDEYGVYAWQDMTFIAQYVETKDGIKYIKETNWNVISYDPWEEETYYSYKVVGYYGNVSNLTIPNTINDCPVTKVAGGAFNGCTTLTSLILQSNMLEIESAAFANCINMSSLYLNDGLTTIKASAFAGCKALTSVFIPSSVITIERNAFMKFNSKSDNVTNEYIEFYCAALSKPDGWESRSIDGPYDVVYGYYWNSHKYYYKTGKGDVTTPVPDSCVHWGATR